MSCRCCQHGFWYTSKRFYPLDPKNTSKNLCLEQWFVDSIDTSTSQQGVNVDFVCEPFRSQCHCPWICLFGHFYSRSRGKEQIAALLASVMSFRKLRFVRQACLESMTNYVIRSAGRSPVLPQVTLKGVAKNMVLLRTNESFFVFFKHRCSIQVWMRARWRCLHFCHHRCRGLQELWLCGIVDVLHAQKDKVVEWWETVGSGHKIRTAYRNCFPEA